MKKSKLGLPLEYGELSAYYDALSQDSDHLGNRTLEKILREHQVKTVIDLTCGTGSQVFWLAHHGYKVTGADFSPTLLEIAKDKAREEKGDVTLLEGDMRTLQAGHFDAAITMFNAIGHLTKADFEKALHTINRNLKAGGLYIFDIFNLDAMTDKAVTDLAMDVTETLNGTSIRKVQVSELDRESGQLTSYDEFFIQQGPHEPDVLKGQFTLQLYTAAELSAMLINSGFAVVGQYEMDGSPLSEEHSQSILTVAKKGNGKGKSYQ